MIITRTPLRLTLAGGGTDLPSYYERRGGVVLSAAINKYIYIGINQTFTDDYFIKYSQLQRTREIDEIEHPIIREALKLHPVGPAIELVSMADIPAGTGLGSSGAFTVGLLRTLYSHKREHVAAASLAEEACHIEIDRLGRAVGKQDQYIAAFGGVTGFEFLPDDRVVAHPLRLDSETLFNLEDNLLLYFTGYSRSPSAILKEQDEASRRQDAAMAGTALSQINKAAEIMRNGGNAPSAGFYEQQLPRARAIVARLRKR